MVDDEYVMCTCTDCDLDCALDNNHLKSTFGFNIDYDLCVDKRIITLRCYTDSMLHCL